MPGKSQRLSTLTVRVLRVLMRANVQPSAELGDVLLVQAAFLQHGSGKERFMEQAAHAWDQAQTADYGAAVGSALSSEEASHPPTPRDQLEALACEIGDALKAIVPAGVGFAGFAFTFGPGGYTAYASNANRGDMTKMLEEFVAKCRRIN
jgi:hypothetical protein